MRKLHLVGLTTDRDGLIFTARKGSKSGGFIVPLDDKVLAAVAEASGRDNGGRAADEAAVEAVEAVPKRLRSESALTPREMQARLRAGRSIEEVAAEAGVDTEWVARFAVPILAEQAQVVELARALVYAKPRLGESTQPLGSSVLQNLSDRGVFLPDDVANAGWSAFQLHDSVWMVRFRYRSRGRDQEAQWEIDVPAGRLRARNRHASDLGYVDPDRWRREEEPEDDPAGGDDIAPPPPRRRRAPGPRAKAPAAKAPRGAKAATKANGAKATTVARAAKAARTTKGGRATAAKTSPRTASAKSPARRRPAKAVPAPEPGPTAGSGGVRMAVARVSTARVAASMAAAEREPWAAVVKRPARAQPRASSDAAVQPTVPPRQRASDRGRDQARGGRAFAPRPLPAPGQEPPPRARRVTVARPVRADDGGPPAVSLPAPRRPAPSQEALPVERPKRRRLRPR